MHTLFPFDATSQGCSSTDEMIWTKLESYFYKFAIVPECLLQMVYPYGPTLMVLHVQTTMEIV